MPTPDEWREQRDLRLEMLEDTPLAYLERLDDARRLDDDGWRRRAATRNGDRSLSLVAVSDDGRFIGGMGCYLPDERSGPWLVAVYVAPRFRGRARGVADALLADVETWAGARSATLRLEVNERNLRARAFYAARGFVETGARRPYPLDPSLEEIEMVKRLVP